VTFCQNIGIAASGPIAGYILQTTGRLDSTFLGISMFALAAAAVAVTLKSK
jgi:predicted MFS family arabinose efflux permease